MVIEFCGRLIDTKLEYSTAPALKYAQKALEKELREQKKEILSIEYSREYLALSTNENEELEFPPNSNTEFTDDIKRKESSSNSFDFYYEKAYFRLDLVV